MVVVKKEVRSYIVKVARKIFTSYGFRKTTMEAIAAATRKGKSSMEKEAEELKSQLEETIRQDDSPVEKLKNYILFRLHHVRTVENFYAALNDECLSEMDFILEIRRQFDREEQQVVRGILEEGMRDGAFQLASAEIGAVAIATMMKGLELPLLLSDDHKADREKLLEDMVSVLFYGIIKR
jgi:AcrR family transcriptional regulator